MGPQYAEQQSPFFAQIVLTGLHAAATGLSTAKAAVIAARVALTLPNKDRREDFTVLRCLAKSSNFLGSIAHLAF